MSDETEFEAQALEIIRAWAGPEEGWHVAVEDEVVAGGAAALERAWRATAARHALPVPPDLPARARVTALTIVHGARGPDGVDDAIREDVARRSPKRRH